MDIQRPKSKQPIPEHAKKVFKGILFDVYQWEQELYNGSKTTFEKLKSRDTTIVFPILPNGNILLAEQEQPGKEPFVGGLGGRAEEGEDTLVAIKRELLEESGYEADEYIFWDAQHVTSKIDYVVFIFIAKGLKKVADTNLDAGEKITLKEVTFEEFLEVVTNDNFIDKEVSMKVLKARLDPEKLDELKELFKPIS